MKPIRIEAITILTNLIRNDSLKEKRFPFLLNFFENQLAFDQKIKSLYLILSAFLGLSFYLLICYFIKAFKLSDIKLKY